MNPHCPPWLALLGDVLATIGFALVALAFIWLISVITP
jgi:hypothetical protein